MNKKKENGITLIALMITVIVMMIIAAISVYEAKSLIADAKAETLETNMLTIKAKAKGYIEEVEAEIWNSSNKETDMNDKLQKDYGMQIYEGAVNNDGSEVVEVEGKTIVAYEITSTTLGKMGLNDLANDVTNGDEYIVVFYLDDYKVMDVIYTNGISYKGETCYSLSKLQAVLEGTQN